MKTLLHIALLSALVASFGCESDEHEHYGGYYDREEHGHGTYREYPDHGVVPERDWDGQREGRWEHDPGRQY
jgi:hypothetical protein